MKDEDFKTLMLASKEVNSAFTSLELYNVAVHVTSTSSAEKLKQIMQMCFDSVETIYLGWNAEKCQTLSALLPKLSTVTPSVSICVVGHWAQDGRLIEGHINGLHRNFMLCHSKEDMWESIIHAFSYEGQSVLVMMDDSCDPGEAV
jgi:flagellar biosynthesis protein FlhB